MDAAAVKEKRATGLATLRHGNAVRTTTNLSGRD